MPLDPDFVARRDKGFTPNPAWAAVDNYTMSHLHPPSRPNHKHLEAALENSQAKGLPPIESSPVQSKFLALQCRLANVKNVLEVGTLGGYTPIWIATENPDCHVTSIEVDSNHARVAQENITNAGVSDRVTVLVGSALDILPKMLAEIEAGKRERFGMSFIDADKMNNWTYFDLAVKMSYPKASVIVDNMACRGMLVAEGRENDTHVQGARKVIELAGKDSRVDVVVMQIVSQRNYDGFLLAVVT